MPEILSTPNYDLSSAPDVFEIFAPAASAPRVVLTDLNDDAPGDLLAASALMSA